MKLLKTDEIIQHARAQLREILGDVKGFHVSNSQWFVHEEPPSREPSHDLEFRVDTPGSGDYRLCVEVKNQGHPKIAHHAILQLKHNAEKHPKPGPCYLVFAAPYISPEAAQICRKAGVGYFDFSGNCHLSFGSVHIHVEGKPNQYKPKREFGSLFSPKASCVLRILLQGPLRPWKVVELEKASGVSLGTISSVRGELLKQTWAEDTEHGLQITKPDAVLDAWVKEDDWSKRTTVREYSLLTKNQHEIADKLHRLLEPGKHAFTQWFAALLRRPYTETSVVTLYLSTFLDEDLIKGELLGRRVESGGSLRLVVPKDDGVFIGGQTVNGLPLVSDLQIYLDLVDAGLRGDEAANELRNGKAFNGGWHD